MALTTVLLDFDGVIRHFDPAHAAQVEARHGLRAGNLTEAAFEPALLDGVLTGRTSRLDWVEEIGNRVSCPAAVGEWMADRGTVDTAMLAEVDALRSSGIVVAVLTNGTDGTGAEMTQLGMDERFDAIFNSAEIGYAKPDRRAFETVCSSLSVDPHDVFFTDDSASKLGGAVEIGMTASLFEGLEDFRRRLAATGMRAT